jgi:hypothetical protein
MPAPVTNCSKSSKSVISADRRVTSQLPLYAWHEVTGDPTYANEILDCLGNMRIVSN